MTTFLRIVPLLVVLPVAWKAENAGGQEPIAGREPGFRPLFDGRTLDGWEGNRDMFRVEQGAIVAGTLEQPIPHNEFLCTRQSFQDFELRLQARLRGQGKNAGIQFRSRRIPDHHEVIGYQCDMGVMGDRPIWGALYDESRRRRMLVEGDADTIRRVLRPNDWNDFRIRCEGPRVRIWLNDARIVDYREPDKKIARRGLIGLQIHGGPPAEASYRNLRIRTLESKAPPSP